MQELTVREYKNSDQAEVFQVYKQSFLGAPWFEDLSDTEIEKRWADQSIKPGFTCLVAEYDGQVVGAHWFDNTNHKLLIEERGNELACWVRINRTNHRVIWERELIVLPDFQRKGIGSDLRREFMSVCFRNKGGKIMILTRMREDNIGSIKCAEKSGYERTGVTVSASQKPLKHEYWFRLLD